MLNKYLLGIIILILSACSGETYDISNAVNILPERKEALSSDGIALQNVSISPNFTDYYRGDFKEQKLANLSSINSNFEIKNDVVYYVNNSMQLIGIDISTSKKVLEVNLISKGFDIKKSNIHYSRLTTEEDGAVIVTNFGYIFYVDLAQATLTWAAQLKNIIPLKPLIFEGEVMILDGTGGITSYNQKNGEIIFNGSSIEDQTGINFEAVNGLEPEIIPSANLVVSYYRGDLLFFDTRTKARFAVPLMESIMNFGHITSNPIISNGGIFASTTSNLNAVSYFSGAKIWSINGVFKRNYNVGEFIFSFVDNENIVAVYKQNGKIKFNIDFKSKDAFIAPIMEGKFFVIASNGEVSFYNLETGNFIEKLKSKHRSDKFDYKLINGKIYYTNNNRLIVLN